MIMKRLYSQHSRIPLRIADAVLFIITASFVLVGCGKGTDKMSTSDHGHGAQTSAASMKPEVPDDLVTSLRGDQMKAIDIRFGSIEQKQLHGSLRVTGSLRVPNQHRATVSSLMGGVVQSIAVQMGSTVRKGQLVATLAHHSFVSLQEEYLSTSAKLTMADREAKRQTTLQQGNATAVRQYQQAEADAQVLRARKAALEAQLKLIGIEPTEVTPENIRGTIRVTSPIAGTIHRIPVNIGSIVDASTPIAEVIDNTQLHVDLDVFEKDLWALRVGHLVHFTLTNIPGPTYDATVFSISNSFEENSKTISVHADVVGNTRGLIDGMSVTGLIALDSALSDAVPSDAVVRHNNRDYIVIEDAGASSADGRTHFRFIPVKRGVSDIGYTAITPLRPLPTNARVVTNGAYFVLGTISVIGE
jgi:cobalt-zinc-cadmium efflux system membrane fusion protein